MSMLLCSMTQTWRNCAKLMRSRWWMRSMGIPEYLLGIGGVAFIGSWSAFGWMNWKPEHNLVLFMCTVFSGVCSALAISIYMQEEVRK